MNNDFVLSRERMLHLMDLGVCVWGAGLCWVNDLTRELERKWFLRVFTEHLRENAERANDRTLYVPAFTMSELMDAIPKHVFIDGQRSLMIDYDNGEVGYFGFDYKLGECNVTGTDDFDTDAPMMDKLYSLLCWAVKKGLVNTQSSVKKE